MKSSRFALMIFLGLLGCYNPNVKDCRVPCESSAGCPHLFSCSNGFCSKGEVCAAGPKDAATEEVGVSECTPGGLCPLGFLCHLPTNRCFRPDAAVPDLGCRTTPPLCAELPAGGRACNPACQTGCGCEGRCNVAVAGATTRCVPIGTKQLGELCSPGGGGNEGFDDCAAGLICLAESSTCGSNVHRCYRLCDRDEQCMPKDDVLCRIPIVSNQGQDTGFRACDVPVQDCDPQAQTGCPSGFTCFVKENGKTVCDCPTNTLQVGPTEHPGPGAIRARCAIYSDCAGGLVCLLSPGADGGQAGSCRLLCASDASCLPETYCMPIAQKLGACVGRPAASSGG